MKNIEVKDELEIMKSDMQRQEDFKNLIIELKQKRKEEAAEYANKFNILINNTINLDK